MAWITVEDLGSVLGKSISTGSDTQAAELLVSAACDALKAAISRDLEATTYTQTFNGHGGDKLFMPQFPIISVTSVTVDGVTIPPRPSVPGAGFAWDEDGIYLQGYRFNKGVQNVAVVYRAGYEPSAIPQALKWAALELASLRWKQRTNQGVSSRNLGGEVVTFDRSDFPESVKALVTSFRNVVPL